MSGGAGDDFLSGSSGNDTLTGGAGEDIFSGSSGNDTLNAADGEQDVLYCGTGTDTTNDDGPTVDTIRPDCES